MKDYRKLIIQCEREVNELHTSLWITFEHRDKSPRQHEDWTRAVQAFREYDSPVYGLVRECLKNGLENNAELRCFAFAYIEYDPYFFRSGYMLESLLQRVKKLTLTSSEKDCLRRIIIKRIERRALRNFRHLCRFIPRINSDQFYFELQSRAKSKNPNVQRRAEFALSYIS